MLWGVFIYVHAHVHSTSRRYVEPHAWPSRDPRSLIPWFQYCTYTKKVNLKLFEPLGKLSHFP